MRTVLTGEVALAQSWDRDDYVLLEVQNGSGTWIDVGAALGKHWIVNAAWGEAVDTPVSQATFALVQQIGSASLSPLMAASVLNVDDVGAYAPLLNIGRLVRASSATMTHGVALDVSKYRKFFDGRIDSVQQADPGGGWAGPITIVCSDLGGWLQDMQIETSGVQYGTTPVGTALETVIQSILDTNIPAGEPAVTLYKQSSSAFAVTDWSQGETKVLDALSTIVLDSTGEDIRYRYDASHVSRLTWFNPDRARVTVDATFTARQYILRELDLSLGNIRNAGELLYDGGTVTATSVDSIADFRRRFFRLPTSVMLTTEAEAQAVIDAVVNDLSFPPGEAAADCPFLWFVQLYDRYTFQANARQYDADQTFGVMGYQHTIESGKGSTTLTLTARIVGAFNAWLHRISDPTALLPKLQPFTYVDSETTRVFSWARNAATAAVWVYDNLLFVGLPDPYDTGALPIVVLSAGTDTYTALKPSAGQQRGLHFIPFSASGVPGDVRHEYIDPAPTALAGTVKAAVNNGTADLTLHVAGSASNWPVAVDLYEDDPDGMPIYSTSVSAVTDIAPVGALIGRVLPLRELRRWYLRLTDVAGVKVWGIGSADRNPLSNGSVTRADYKALPSFTATYDDDTDSIRVTAPTGKTKTVAGLTGSGTWTYTVGDLLDDATTEVALITDETRTPYLVEFQGGGVWTQFFNGPLHGLASKPPVVLPRVVLSTNRDTANIFALMISPTGEKCRLFYRDSEASAAPEYGLCVGAADPTPRYVDSVTEIGPSDYFTFSAVQTQKLSAVALTRDQIGRRYLCAQGQDSGIRSPWVPIPLSTKEQPWLESIAAIWNAAAGTYDVTLVGGANCSSALIEVADNSAFATALSSSGALSDGGTLAHSFALTGAQLGKIWYARGTPNNAAALAGLNGVSQQDSDMIPAAYALTIGVRMATNAGVTGPPFNQLDVTLTHGGLPAGATVDVSYNNGVAGGVDAKNVAVSASPMTVTFSTVTFAGSPGTGLVSADAKDANGNLLVTATPKGKPAYVT